MKFFKSNPCMGRNKNCFKNYFEFQEKAQHSVGRQLLHVQPFGRENTVKALGG